MEQRHLILFGPRKAVRESRTRQRLLDLSIKPLAEIAVYKCATTVEKFGARVGKVLAKYKMGKFIQWAIEADPQQKKCCPHRLTWSISTEKVEREKRFVGC
ncbi:MULTISPECIES: hypothetical protein [Thiorhodovibrio]|uniref:hypothetical protein n=1 Tax=Thiorhodovibrio TaxID=61593 RepID=UPI0019147917|nr:MULTISPECIES: hypothetical protein [Thiorhodovibrio]MBK5967505.1 hypothetical protein [Thiorhodovibrio winogradskyi]